MTTYIRVKELELTELFYELSETEILPTSIPIKEDLKYKLERFKKFREEILEILKLIRTYALFWEDLSCEDLQNLKKYINDPEELSTIENLIKDKS